jgi:hypothetical protein
MAWLPLSMHFVTMRTDFGKAIPMAPPWHSPPSLPLAPWPPMTSFRSNVLSLIVPVPITQMPHSLCLPEALRLRAQSRREARPELIARVALFKGNPYVGRRD